MPWKHFTTHYNKEKKNILNFVIFTTNNSLSKWNQTDGWEFNNEVFSEHFSVGLELSDVI